MNHEVQSTQIKKTMLAAAVATALVAGNVQAANWLMLQGTEPANSAERAKVWGFVQAEYQQTDDTPLPSGKKAAFNQLAPDLTTSSGFNIKRARIGVRGANLPLDSKVNYFLLAEFGNNGITTGGNAGPGQVTDASITLNHIPGARIRVGQFKTPGVEESLQAAPVFNYVNFTNMTDRIINERQFTYSTGNTGRNGSNSSFRDIGVQVFDAFNVKGYEISYALMYGNGNGLNRSDNNKFKDLYTYVSLEKYFSDDKGPRAKSFKIFAWNQDGKRTLTTSPTVATSMDKNRTRSGLGTTFFNGKFRAAAEYITADGMIYGGSSGGGLPSDGATFSVQADEKANGYYLDLGYRVIPKLELKVRYDTLNSGTEVASNERKFTTTTIGGQYFINKKTTLLVDYEMREASAPNLASTHAANKILDTMDNRIAIQLGVVF